MFSPQPQTGDALLNPAARRRGRPSRPTSRVQLRHERSNSGMSVDSTREESSIGASQRQDSEGATNASGDQSIIRRSAVAVSGKEQEGGSTDLTKNDKYRVSKLPGLPSIFSSCSKNGTPVTAYADSNHRYALLLSHDAAYVWEYAVPHILPLTFSFPLPREGSSEQSPFPLGSLVCPSANSPEPGLVVVMPMTGRIAYWDAVSSAVSEGLFAKKRGVEGKVPTMSGETITSICCAEPAGFVISTSSGRLAHLALRDTAGRPGVTVTIMRGSSGFGGLLGALRAGSNRRDIVAVRAGKVLRMGEREVFVGTARGNFSRWHVNRAGGYANTTDVDLRDEILTAFSGQRALQGKNKDNFQVVDLQVTGYSASTEPGQEDTVQFLVLTAISSPNSKATYALVSLELMAGGTASVGDIHIIKSYTDGWGTETPPRLYFPLPRKTAFVVFPRAVVVVSKIRRDPSEMDYDDDQQQQEPFEDVVDFRGELGIEIVGSGSESVDIDIVGAEAMGSFSSDQGHIKRIKNPGVILITKGAGILRVEAFDFSAGAKTITAPVTVKSKLEQAVFYGTKSDNPLNFHGRLEVKFALEDLEEAALEISQEILGSKSPYLPSMLPSLGSHLEMRSQHLRALVQHLRTGAFGRVSKQVLWRLLQDAEKCEAARAVWDMRNEHLREDPENGDGVLGAVISHYVPTEDTDVTGNDPVRTWFQRDVVHIGKLLRHVKKSLASMPDKGKKNQLILAVSDSEANDIIIGALERAWQFRVDCAKLYELSGEHGIDKNGLLEKSDGYLAPWTSDALLLEALSNQRDLSEAAIKALWGPTEDPKRQDVVTKLGLQLVHLAEICCRSFEERADWCDQQTVAGDDIPQEGRNVRERYVHSRGGWIKPLVKYGLIEHAYGIAEDYQDYRTLVEICSEELLKTEVSLIESTPAQQNSETVNELKEKKAEVGKRLEGYFERFGEPFAIEMYEYLVENGKLQTLLNGFESWREQYLTPFLRGNPKYAKLSWIHDVSLGDYSTAANTLFSIATKSEGVLLNQRIELSIGKLAKLAALENASASEIDVAEEIEAYDIRLEIVKIQQRLHSVVKHITHNAIDVDAAVQLATDEYARKLKKLPALRDLFRTSFRQLVSGRALATEDLVELLTLMEPSEGELMDGESFFWALRVIGLAGLPRAEIENAEKTIWRRCFLRDDWTQIVSTRNRTDEDVTDLARKTSVYTTILLCYQNGLFTQGSPFKPRSPEETLFSEDPGEIRIRFPEADERLLEALAIDLYEENRRLRRHITKADLQNWFTGMLAQIKEEVAARTVEAEGGDGDVEMDV